MKKVQAKYSTWAANVSAGLAPVNEWNIEQTKADMSGGPIGSAEIAYADQIPPFDIVITFHNEYGKTAHMVLYGVEILNEGSGMSIDDISTELACTFIARKMDYIRPGLKIGGSAYRNA